MEVETTFTGFADRAEAARRLAQMLKRYRGNRNAIVIGLPRGGVVTAAAIAGELDLPLDVVVVRKLGVPGNELLAMGAIGHGGVRVLDPDVISAYRVLPNEMEAVSLHERAELQRRELMFRGQYPPLDLKDRTAIVVDDGLSTGSTMEAALEVVRNAGAGRIVLAVPVAPVETLDRFHFEVDELVYLETPEPFGSIGWWYVDFPEITDDDVVRVLEEMRSRTLVGA